MRIEVMDENGNVIYCTEGELRKQNSLAKKIKRGLKTFGRLVVEDAPTVAEAVITGLIVGAAVSHIRKN